MGGMPDEQKSDPTREGTGHLSDEFIVVFRGGDSVLSMEISAHSMSSDIPVDPPLLGYVLEHVGSPHDSARKRDGPR